MSRKAIEFQTIRSEGGLLPPDLLRRILDPKEKLDGTQPEDYGLPKGERLNEVITQSWGRLRKHWREFRAAAVNLPAGEAGTGLTNDKWSLPLLRELGFGLLPASAGPEVGGRVYAINRLFGPVPIHLIGCALSLDHRAPGVRGAALSNPHGLVQEFLNRSAAHMWGVVSNGVQFRILRDNQALSRQSFLEFDLEAMFSGELYSDFVLLWLIAHATRFAPREADKADTCWLEVWTKVANEQGTRALQYLRGGVEEALQILGEGFTAHPRNTALRENLRSGQASLADFHAQLLRVVYRFIFLFVAEDRTLDGQSLLHPRDGSESAQIARERYATNYSTARLRDLASNIKGSRHGDLWRQFQIIVGALSGNPIFAATRESLALPALGSFLWDARSTSVLNDTELTNHDFLEAIRHLAFTRPDKMLRPVDFKNLGAEELGGVYETLLALTPQLSADGARFTFAEFAGNERKTSGSYYTPDSLVQSLLDSALDPVVEEAVKGKTGSDAEKAILALKVCDPAVGSGHFLVGAAHRLARHLARVRAVAHGESEPSPLLYQHALRDVIGHCLYGVDINPMAAELCRVSLWLEAIEPGKPLSFLEHRIQVGNSLLGATPALLANGIPDEAFIPLEGDEKEICREFKRINRDERNRQTRLFAATTEPWQQLGNLAVSLANMDAVGDDSLAGIEEKERLYEQTIRSSDYLSGRFWADTWCAAFVWKKTRDFRYPITEEVFRRVEHNPHGIDAWMRAEIEHLARQYRFFHWHLAFPDVFQVVGDNFALGNKEAGWNGGFDVMLGNPPWVRQELFKPLKNLLAVYRSFTSTADLSVFFLELSVALLSNRGRCALLTPNKWFRAAYGERLRAHLRAQARMYLIIDFGHSKNLFDADTFPAGIVLARVSNAPDDGAQFKFAAADDERRAKYSLQELINSRSLQIAHGSLQASGWIFNDSHVSAVLEAMRVNGKSLSEVIGGAPLYGIKTGFNEAFYIDDEKAQLLIEHEPQSAGLVKRFIRGRDVKRWVVEWENHWHIVIPSSHNQSWAWANTESEQEAEAMFAAAHPAIHAHLKKFESGLRGRIDQGKFWWELRSCNYYDQFLNPKIVIARIAFHSACGLDTIGYFQNDSTVLLPSSDLFVLAALNSRVGWWYMTLTFPHKKDEAISMDVDYLERFPIPNLTDEGKEEIRRQCRTILDLRTHTRSPAEVIPLERELSSALWRAYGLDPSSESILDHVPVPRDPISLLAGRWPCTEEARDVNAAEAVADE